MPKKATPPPAAQVPTPGCSSPSKSVQFSETVVAITPDGEKRHEALLQRASRELLYFSPPPLSLECDEIESQCLQFLSDERGRLSFESSPASSSVSFSPTAGFASFTTATAAAATARDTGGARRTGRPSKTSHSNDASRGGPRRVLVIETNQNPPMRAQIVQIGTHSPPKPKSPDSDDDPTYARILTSDDSPLCSSPPVFRHRKPPSPPESERSAVYEPLYSKINKQNRRRLEPLPLFEHQAATTSTSSESALPSATDDSQSNSARSCHSSDLSYEPDEVDAIVRDTDNTALVQLSLLEERLSSLGSPNAADEETSIPPLHPFVSPTTSAGLDRETSVATSIDLENLISAELETHSLMSKCSSPCWFPPSSPTSSSSLSPSMLLQLQSPLAQPATYSALLSPRSSSPLSTCSVYSLPSWWDDSEQRSESRCSTLSYEALEKVRGQLDQLNVREVEKRRKTLSLPRLRRGLHTTSPHTSPDRRVETPTGHLVDFTELDLLAKEIPKIEITPHSAQLLSKELQREIDTQRDLHLTISDRSQSLIHGVHAPSEEALHIKARVDEMNARWDNLRLRIVSLRTRLESGADHWQQLMLSLRELVEWVVKKETELGAQPQIGGDVATIMRQQDDHRNFRVQLDDKRPIVESALLAGRNFLQREGNSEMTPPEQYERRASNGGTRGGSNGPNGLGPGGNADEDKRELVRSIRRDVTKLTEKWDILVAHTDQRHKRLDDVLNKMQALQRALDELGGRLQTAEGAKQNWPSVQDFSMDQLAQQIDDLKDFRDRVAPMQVAVDGVNEAAAAITACGVVLSQHNLTRLEDLNSRWRILQLALEERRKQLEHALHDQGASQQGFLNGK